MAEPYVDTKEVLKPKQGLKRTDKAAIKRAISSKEMDESEKKEKDLNKSKEKVLRARDRLTAAEFSRQKYDKEWTARELFRRGYQFVNQNGTGAITIGSSARARIPINYLQTYVRSIRNQVTSWNPKWEVLPQFKGREAQENARMVGKLLDNLYIKMNMSKRIKEAVTQGLITSVGGPFEDAWNPYYDNGPQSPRGEVEVILHDPFDVYFDPDGTEVEDCQYIIKVVRTSLDKAKNNPAYSDEFRQKLTTAAGSGRKAYSVYKQFLLQAMQSGSTQAEDAQSILMFEQQSKEFQEDGSIKLNFLTWCDEVDVPARDETIDQEWYDLELFQADISPLEIYGESWSKHVVAQNRVLNALESSEFDYHYKYAKGRLRIDKNAGVRAVTNEHGSIVEAKPGAVVAPIPIQPLPASLDNQIARTRQYLADLSGVQDPMLGRVPVGIKSGIGLAELKQSSASNQDDLVQALELCLMRLGQKILKKIAKHYNTPRIVAVVGAGKMVEHFAVVGEDFIDKDKTTWKVGKQEYPLVKIGYNNELRVTIGSWLSYSKEAQQQTIVKLAEAGFIPQEDLLRHLEFPNIEEIVDRSRAEKILDMKRKESTMMPFGISQEELALSENEMLSEGSPVPVDPEMDDHDVHIAVHQNILSDGQGSRQIIDHIAEHRRAQKGGGLPVDQREMMAPAEEVLQEPAPEAGLEGMAPPEGAPLAIAGASPLAMEAMA